ncbi:MAG: hypothetical protein JSW07_18165 [bacterium]|nr:MAG: hypothetical protein JSW07_18165 [bacterium]
MKKLLLIVFALIILVPAFAFAENPLKVVVPDKSAIQWDAVTALVDGSPIPAGETVQYQIFLGPHPIPAGQDPNDASLYTLLGSTTETIFTINFPAEGVYIAGVRAVRIMDSVENYSSISWSTNHAVTVEAWYYVYMIPYAQPMGLKP